MAGPVDLLLYLGQLPSNQKMHLILLLSGSDKVNDIPCFFFGIVGVRKGYIASLGGMVAQVVSIAASKCQRPGFDSWLGSLLVWSLHILPLSAWVSFGCSGFLLQSKRCAG